MNEIGEENLTEQPKTPEPKEIIRTRKEIIETRIESYKDWQRTLDGRVERGELTPDKKATIIARAMLARELMAGRYKDKAYRDPLTNLPNKRAFKERYASNINKKVPFGFLIVDIDHFKKVNDTYGHDVGDSVLIQTALSLGTNLRELRTEENFDFVASRFGGEEFTVLLPGIQNEVDLMTVAERLRLSVGENPFSVMVDKKSKTIPVTISLGGAIYRGEDPKEFFERVDKKALYQAKDQGRNRTVILERETVNV